MKKYKNDELIRAKAATIRWNDVLFVLSALIYRVMLDWGYKVLSTSYFKVQFALNINEEKVLLSYIIVLILCMLTVHKSGSKVFFIRMLLFMTVIPNTSVYGMRDGSSVFFVWVTLSFAITEIFVLNLKFWRNDEIRKKNIRNKTYEFGRKKHIRKTDQVGTLINIILMLFTIITIICMYVSNGMPGTIALNLYKVYEVRNSYQASKYLNYAISLVSTVIVPFGMADGYATGSKGKFIFYTIVQLTLFLWTGNKVFLFSLIIIIGLLIIIRCRLTRNVFFYGITSITFLGNLSCIFENEIFEFIFSLVNRRMLLDSATLKYFYYDYFVVHDQTVLGLGGTVLAPFWGKGLGTEYRYDLSYYYTGMKSNANTGIFGGDFAQLGIFAFVVVPVLLIMLFYLIERVEHYCGSAFVLLFFVYTIYYLNETCIFLYLFNFTGILVCIISLFYRYKNCKNMGTVLN